MGPVEKLLRAAGERITPEGTVCVGGYALDSNGKAVRAGSAVACQWCAIGAVYASEVEFREKRDAVDLLNAIAERLGYTSIMAANDFSRGRITRDLYSEAIEAAAELGL